LKRGSRAAGLRGSRSKDALNVAWFPFFCRPDYSTYTDYFSTSFSSVCQCPIHMLACHADSPFLSDEECCIVHPSLYQRPCKPFPGFFFQCLFHPSFLSNAVCYSPISAILLLLHTHPHFPRSCPAPTCIYVLFHPPMSTPMPLLYLYP